MIPKKQKKVFSATLLATSLLSTVKVQAAGITTWPTKLWRIIKSITNTGSNWISISPKTDINEYYIKVGSGSIDFNQGDYGGILECDVTVDSTNSEIDSWSERSFFDCFSKINISYNNPNGQLVNNKSVTTLQHFIVKPNVTGQWNVRYTTSESKKWSSWFIYDPVALFSVGQASYLAKSSDIWYNEDIDATEISFEGLENELITWIFKGDLTESHKKDEILRLKFNVIEDIKSPNHVFETIDYVKDCMKQSGNDKYPSINKYLLK